MSKTAIEKFAKLEHCIVEVKVSQVGGTDEFLGHCNANQYDPEKFIPNGGPVTRKGVSVSALGSTYNDAYENALEKAATLMGL